jgi:hypothetical protein
MKLVTGIALFASLVFAGGGATSYNITLSERSIVAGKELKPGDYKVEVVGDKATIKGGSQTVETTVSVQENGTKFSRTAVRYDNADGKYRLDQIQVGGSKTTLVFGKDAGAQAEKPAVR